MDVGTIDTADALDRHILDLVHMILGMLDRISRGLTWIEIEPEEDLIMDHL